MFKNIGFINPKLKTHCFLYEHDKLNKKNKMNHLRHVQFMIPVGHCFKQKKRQQMCGYLLIIEPLFELSGAKNCAQNPLKIHNGDWPGPLAFLHNLSPAHTLNICSHSLFLS